jgi:hypothetical protein
VKLPAAFRVVGNADRFPFEVKDDAKAVAVCLDPEANTVASVAAALPDPETLDPRTLVVVVPGSGSFVKRLFGAKPVSRAVRCSALLARGYVDIGADVDPETKLDVALAFSSRLALKSEI